MKSHHTTHSSISFTFIILFLFLFFISLSFSAPNLESSKPKRKQLVSAIFVFGDSIVDPGNNNYIKTIARSNFPPYGLDFENNIPTGRFCNGRLVTDFIGSYIGVKENVPAYLDPNLGINELMTGVSFGSAGAGFDPLTAAITNVISMQGQLELFREYKKKLENKIGKQKMEKQIAEAVYVIIAGSDDFLNYFTVPIRRKTFTIEAYQQFIINNTKQFIQGLSQEGARIIGVTDLPPIGCLPVVITLFSGEPLINRRRCVDRFNAVARNYNVLLRKEMSLMQKSLAQYGSRILVLDAYTPIDEIIHEPRKFGFEEVSIGCCGSGYLETSFLCNPKSFVRPNRSTFVFFDSVHPTQKAYFRIFETLRPSIDFILSDNPII